MTQQAQAEALRLANLLDDNRQAFGDCGDSSKEKSAAELRRLHARVQELIETLYAEVQHSAGLKAELEAQQAAPQMPNQFHTALDRFDAYFRSANGVPPNARISVPTAEWQELRAMLAAQAAHQTGMRDTFRLGGRCEQHLCPKPCSQCATPPAHSTGCPNCGSTEIHACTGSKIEWTQREKKELARIMGEAFPTPPAQEQKPQYRLLGLGELMQEGDEHINDDTETWTPIRKGFVKAGAKWSGAWQPMRRKITDSGGIGAINAD